MLVASRLALGFDVNTGREHLTLRLSECDGLARCIVRVNSEAREMKDVRFVELCSVRWKYIGAFGLRVWKWRCSITL